MSRTRKLSLKREALVELSSDELAGVAGGAITKLTCFSCMTYVSCNPLDCIDVVTLDRDCIN